jgi:hypothetical protein
LKPSQPKAQSRTGENVLIVGGLTETVVGIGTNAVGAGDASGFLRLETVGLNLISKASDIQHNILQKELQSKTLSPGTTTQGFAYLRVPYARQREIIHLKIPFKRVRDESTVIMDLTF